MEMNWIFYFPLVVASFYMIAAVVASFWGWRRRAELISNAKVPKRCCYFETGYTTISIYNVAIITCADYFIDIWVMLNWMDESHTRNLGYLSLTILLSQRIISALVFAQEYGCRSGICQLFDLELFNLISVSVQFQRPVYGLKKYKILEGLLESFPQLMMQTYWLSGNDDVENLWLFHLSILTSLLSLAMCYLISDIYGIKESAVNNNSIIRSKTFFDKKNIFRVMFCYGSLGLWRVGEIASRISVCVTFARLVSAKKGTVGISLVLLIFNWILIWVYDDTIKATIFYHKKREANIVRRLRGMSGLKVTPSLSRKTGDSWKSTSLKTRNSRSFSVETPHSAVRTSDSWTATKEISMDTQIEGCLLNKMDVELKQLQLENYLRQRSTFKRWQDIFSQKLSKMRKIIFVITNYVGVGMFASLALPSLYPSSYVKLYYLFKVVFECFLIVWCIIHSNNSDNNDRHDRFDLFHLVHNRIISDVLWYWIIGIISCFIGGLLSYFFVLDIDKWKRYLEPDDICLLDMMKAGKYAYVDRAIGNKVCTLEDIIQRTVQKRGTKSLSEKNCSLLLCNMLRNGIIELAPKYGKTQIGKTNSWINANSLVSALLKNFDESPSSSKVSKFAKLVFSDLLKKVSPVHFTFEDLRNAGVSLTFLRFHLKVPDEYFDKNGHFDCTADELHRANFDLLFCLNRNFSCQDLVAAGYKEDHVELLLRDYENYQLEDLKHFKAELFEMHFYVKQLRDCKAFSDMEILKWFTDYKIKSKGFEHESVSFLSKSANNVLEPLYDKPNRERPSKTFTAQFSIQRSSGEAFV